MTGLGLGGSARPRTKPGDFERAWEVITSADGDKKTKAYLAELVAAQASHDAAREKAEAAAAEAARREIEAAKAEQDARSARAALSTATEAARNEVGRREVAVAERERLATEHEQSQDTRAEELAQREGHLREAGVAGF